MTRILGSAPDGSPEWHAMRAGRIGGSSIAAVCGWSPFETRADLLARMAGEVPPKEYSRAMSRGHALEAAVADWLAADKGLTYDPDASAATYGHDDIEWAIFNPDRITTDGVLVEVKTTHERSDEAGWGRAGTDKVPLYYSAQVQWGMGIVGLDSCWLTVLYGAHNGRPKLDRADYRIRRDPAAFRFLLGKAERFIDELNSRKAIAA